MKNFSGLCSVLAFGVTVVYAFPPSTSQESGPPKMTSTPNSLTSINSVTQEVGWRSIFWALFALAILAMSQCSVLDPSDQFPQSSPLFLARASPLLCLSETVETLIYIGLSIKRGLNLRSACTGAFVERVQRRHTGAMSSPTTVDVLRLSVLRAYPKTSTFLFLGVSLQALKLFSFQGVAWVQVIAACYLSSYVVSAGIQLLARDEHPSTLYPPNFGKPLSEIRSKLQSIVFMTMSLFVCAWLLSKVCMAAHLTPKSYAANRPPGDHNKIVVAFIFLVVGVDLYLRIILLMGSSIGIASINEDIVARLDRPTHDRLLKWLSTLVWLIGGFSMLSFVAGLSFLDEENVLPMIWTGSAILVLSWFTIMHLSRIAVSMCKSRRKRILRSRLDDWPFSLIVASSITHLVITFLYLSYVFDPTGTVKPAWTENLG